MVHRSPSISQVCFKRNCNTFFFSGDAIKQWHCFYYAPVKVNPWPTGLWQRSLWTCTVHSTLTTAVLSYVFWKGILRVKTNRRMVILTDQPFLHQNPLGQPGGFTLLPMVRPIMNVSFQTTNVCLPIMNDHMLYHESQSNSTIYV